MNTLKLASGSALGLALALGGGLLLPSAVSAKPGPKKPAPTAAVAPTTGSKNIGLEAEWSKVTKEIQPLKDTECSGGGGIMIPGHVNPKAQEGQPAPKLYGDAIIKFKVANAGNYKIWGRCWWGDGCTNAWGIQVDGGRALVMTDGNYKRWHWVAGPVQQLTAGEHSIRIYNNKDGVKLDQLFVTMDMGRIPVGKEKVNPDALAK